LLEKKIRRRFGEDLEMKTEQPGINLLKRLQVTED
jgi:hypothetical protein